MAYQELTDTSAAEKAIASIDPNKPAYMLNLLKFRPVATMTGTRVPFSGKMVGKVLGLQDDGWDEMAVVKYENVGVFRDTIMSEVYAQTSAPHRVAALADARLFAFELLGTI
ncbi:hypothetical protein AUP68_03712 [Ilyonectria robusta]